MSSQAVVATRRNAGIEQVLALRDAACIKHPSGSQQTIDAGMTVGIAIDVVLVADMLASDAEAIEIALHQYPVRIKGGTHKHELTLGKTTRGAALRSHLRVAVVEQHTIDGTATVIYIARNDDATAQANGIAPGINGRIGHVDAVHRAAVEVDALIAKMPYRVTLVDNLNTIWQIARLCKHGGRQQHHRQGEECQ